MPDQECESQCESPVPGGRRNSSGKRFVRRARRWAELQQKRQGRKCLEEQGSNENNETTTYKPNHRAPEPPYIYDYVEMATLGSGVMVVDKFQNYEFMTIEESKKQNLGHTRSFPCTILHPRRHQVQIPPNFPPPIQQQQPYHNYHQPCHRTNSVSGSPVYYNGTYEYGNTGNQSGIFNPRQDKCYMSSSSSSQISLKNLSETDDSLLLITSDLSNTTISGSASSESPSSTFEDDYTALLPHYKSTNIPKNPYSEVYFDRNFMLSNPLYIPRNFPVNTAPPPERSWVMIRHADPDRPIATFTVLCYNVLCDKYATVNQYSYCPSWALNWEYRKSLIVKEIRTYEADIITLQEVETEQFRTLFTPELKALGYTGIFTPKSRAKTMSEEERKYVDGCAIFWKNEKFDLDREHVIEFTTLAMKKASNSENMLNRVMPRDNVALCAVLKIKENVYANRFSGMPRMSIPQTDNVVGNPLIVCTAHIHWDPEFCDVKLVQTMMLANEVTKLLEDTSVKFKVAAQQCPVLICGDLNSLPDSGVYEYLSRGQVTRRHMDLKAFQNDPCLEKFSNSTDKNLITHPLRLDSACDHSAIPFTNHTLDFKGMIDYIFATPQSLARLGILGPFDSTWIQTNKILGFPHPHVPSDHIPIMAQYAIIPTSHQRQPPPPQHAPLGVIGGGYQQQQQQQHSFLR